MYIYIHANKYINAQINILVVMHNASFKTCVYVRWRDILGLPPREKGPGGVGSRGSLPFQGGARGCRGCPVGFLNGSNPAGMFPNPTETLQIQRKRLNSKGKHINPKSSRDPICSSKARACGY